MTPTIAEQTAREIISKMPMQELLTQWRLTEVLDSSMVRGWILDELKKRDPVAYDKWMSLENPGDPQEFFKEG